MYCHLINSSWIQFPSTDFLKLTLSQIYPHNLIELKATKKINKHLIYYIEKKAS